MINPSFCGPPSLFCPGWDGGKVALHVIKKGQKDAEAALHCSKTMEEGGVNRDN